jgi:integrase
MEELRLRIQDIDLELMQIVVRSGSRTAWEAVRQTRRRRARRVDPPAADPSTAARTASPRCLFLLSRNCGSRSPKCAPFTKRIWPRVTAMWNCPTALRSNTADAPANGAGNTCSPRTGFSVDPRTGRTGRHHLHEVNIQRAVRQAAREARIAKTVTPHILRHSLIRSPVAPSPLRGSLRLSVSRQKPLGSPRTCSKTAPTFAGRRRRRPPCGQLDAGCLALLGCTVQELLGHSDVSTTMIY